MWGLLRNLKYCKPESQAKEIQGLNQSSSLKQLQQHQFKDIPSCRSDRGTKVPGFADYSTIAIMVDAMSLCFDQNDIFRRLIVANKVTIEDNTVDVVATAQKCKNPPIGYRLLLYREDAGSVNHLERRKEVKQHSNLFYESLSNLEKRNYVHKKKTSSITTIVVPCNNRMTTLEVTTNNPKKGSQHQNIVVQLGAKVTQIMF